MRLRVPASFALCAVVATALPAQQRSGSSAQRDSVTELTTVSVRGRADRLAGIARSASEGRVGRVDLKQRPLAREGEILEAVPGLILTQHSGDGKANQMFARGFNLDHGTDFRTNLESMPLNLPSHGHGQGYTDLNPLIPELVEHLEYRMGPLHAEVGDFGSAGSATVHLARRLPGTVARVEAGAFGFARAMAAQSTTIASGDMLLGGELKQYDGPWERSQDLRKASGMARYTRRVHGGELSMLALSYANRWRASDQIPLRAVNRSIGRFGQIDSTLGGSAERHSLSLAWRRPLRTGAFTADAFVVRNRFALNSDFTYFLADSSSGDRIFQSDNRTIAGATAELARVFTTGRVPQSLRMGLQLRYDDIVNGLFNAGDDARDTVRSDHIRQGSAGVYASTETRWLPLLRTTLGLRGDLHAFGVRATDAAHGDSRVAGVLSPKASLAIGPMRGVELYAGGGLGFHSNDARGIVAPLAAGSGVVAERVSPLARSRALELGARFESSAALQSTVSLWYLDLESELLFVGDEGTTEANGGSRRRGVSLTNFWRPSPTLALDADVSLAHSRYAHVPGNQSRIPGALERVATGGVSYTAPRGFDMTLRVRHFGATPLVEDNSVRGTPTTLANASLGYTVPGARARGMRITLTMLNVANSRASDVQYYYRSRLRDEPADGVADVHFHPVEPRQLRFGVSYGTW